MNLDTYHNLVMLVATTLAGGLGVHLFANGLKKLFKFKSSAVIHTMVLALASIGAGAQYILQIHNFIPPVVLGISGPAIYGVSQVIYRYVGYTQDFLGKVNAYNESVAAPAAPASPSSYASSTTQVFSVPAPSGVSSTTISSTPSTTAVSPDF